MKKLISLLSLAIILTSCGSTQKNNKIVRLNGTIVIEHNDIVKHDIEMEEVYLAVKDRDFAEALSRLNNIKVKDGEYIKYNVRSLSHRNGLYSTKFRKIVLRHFISNLQGLWVRAEKKCGSLSKINKSNVSDANVYRVQDMASCYRHVYKTIDTIRTESYSNPLFNSCLTDPRRAHEVRMIRHMSFCAPLAVTTFPNNYGKILANFSSTAQAWLKHWGYSIALEADKLQEELLEKPIFEDGNNL